MFFVTGEFSAPPKNCEINLLSESGVPLPYSLQSLDQQVFSVDFMVSPKPANYQVIVTCAGSIKNTTVVRYGRHTNPGKEVPLGKIAL